MASNKPIAVRNSRRDIFVGWKGIYWHWPDFQGYR